MATVQRTLGGPMEPGDADPPPSAAGSNVRPIKPPSQSPRPLPAEAIASDELFDRLLPPWAQTVSRIHWTPVAVALRAAELLVRDRRSRILDIGAGVGKFCLVGALTQAARFVGVEQREGLVVAGRQLARELGLRQVSFVHGDAFVIDWNDFDGIYFFNPFLENIAEFTNPIPGDTFRSSDRYVAEVEATCVKLHGLRPGVRVATYHGYGAPMPRGFERIFAEALGTDTLEIFEKRA